MRQTTYDSVEAVPEEIWNAVAPSELFFFTRAFMDVMERSGVEGAKYRYVVLFEGDEPVGLAVLSRFLLRLDLLAGDVWVTRIRRLMPKLMDLPIVACGVPASLGQHHLHVTRPELTAAAFAQVHEAMEQWASEARCTMLVWKEWDEGQGMGEHARAHGYAAFPTLPDHGLVDLPATVEEFAGSMRSSYRRKYKSALALMDGPGPVWENAGMRLEDSPFSVEAAEEFNRGYLALMERVDVRLETYTPEFFRGLAESTLDTRRLHLVNEENGDTLTALMIAQGDVLAFALVAKEKAEYEEAMYALLLRSIALYAIRGGFRTVRMGQTSSYSKISMGSHARRLETYLRVRGGLKHKALVRFGSALFPEAEVPELGVFKDSPDGTDAPATPRIPAVDAPN